MVCRINYRPSFGPVVGYALKRSKDPVIVASTMCAVDAKGIISEFEKVASLNTRCKAPCAHFVLSPAAGEKLSPAQWQNLCASTATEFGAKQWFAALHRDTGCEHASLVLSRIQLDGRAWGTSNDRYRLRTICTDFEVSQKLTRTPSKSHEPRLQKEELEKTARLHKAGAKVDAVPERLKIAIAVKAAMKQCPTIEEFERTLLRQKIVTRWRHDEQGQPIGVSYARGEAAISGRNAGITCRSLTVYYGTNGTHTHEQTARFEIPGRGSGLAGPFGGTGRPENPSGYPGANGCPDSDSSPAERFDRNSSLVPGGPAIAIREVGEMLVQAVSGLSIMMDEEAKDSERFIRNQKPKHWPQPKKHISRRITR